MAVSKLQPMRPAEQKLIDLANATETNLNNEIINRTNADTNLQQSIDNEAQTRQTEDQTLQTNINTETTNRETADTNLQNAIDALPKLEFNVRSDIVLAANTSQKVEVTFAEEKAVEPVIILTLKSSEADTSDAFIDCQAIITHISTTGFSFRVYNQSADTQHTVSAEWLAAYLPTPVEALKEE